MIAGAQFTFSTTRDRSKVRCFGRRGIRPIVPNTRNQVSGVRVSVSLVRGNLAARRPIGPRVSPEFGRIFALVLENLAWSRLELPPPAPAASAGRGGVDAAPSARPRLR